MLLKKRIVAWATGLALMAAVAAASVGVANTLVSWSASAPQAVACNAGGSAGGGC